jgi:cell wall-associated NlpC family hydrolase
VYVDKRHEFDDLSKPGNKGYLRPAAAYRADPNSSGLITTVGISLITSIESDPTETEVAISKSLSAAIAVFVNKHLNQQTGLDCYGFVNIVGEKLQHKVAECETHWSLERISPAKISPGDIVAFCTSGSLFRHAAVCVTPDLFISVFGINGDLEFATYEDLRVPYKIEKTYLMKT